MNEEVVKIAFDIKDGLCVSAKDGEVVYTRIKTALDKGDKVRLSFDGVRDLTSSFLNSAVGQLYGTFSEERLKETMLPPIDAKPEDLIILKRVVDRAKDFFKNPQRYQEAAKQELGSDE